MITFQKKRKRMFRLSVIYVTIVFVKNLPVCYCVNHVKRDQKNNQIQIKTLWLICIHIYIHTHIHKYMYTFIIIFKDYIAEYYFVKL